MANTCSIVAEELHVGSISTFQSLSSRRLSNAVSLVMNARDVFVLGIGHSGYFGKVLAMKLNHVGVRAHTVFDGVNPRFERGDLFVAISQSGETATIVSLASTARRLGGRVLAISGNASSHLASISDCVLHLQIRPDQLEFPVLSALGEAKHKNLSAELGTIGI